MGNYIIMKVAVLRTFRDSKHDGALRLAGTQFEEKSATRVKKLAAGGFVKSLDPIIETTTATPQTEKKAKKTTKKSPKKK